MFRPYFPNKKQWFRLFQPWTMYMIEDEKGNELYIDSDDLKLMVSKSFRKHKIKPIIKKLRKNLFEELESKA